MRTMLKSRPRPLTKREKEILLLICDQLSNSQMALRLGIGIRTVEGHRARILKKTKAKNTVGLIIYAIQQKIFKVS